MEDTEGRRGGGEGGEVLHQPPPPQKIRFLPPLPSFALLYISMPIVLRSRNSNAADALHVEF